MRLEISLELVAARVEGGSWDQDDESVGALAETLVRPSDDGDLEHVGMRRQSRLDGQARGVLAAWARQPAMTEHGAPLMIMSFERS